MPEAVFRLDGYRVARLTPAEAADLQDLYERCTDFHELTEGSPTRPTAASEELVALPPGKELADKFPFGVHAPAGRLIGFLDLMRDYPAEREWWIGLLMLDPAVRGAGLGSRIYRAAAEWVGSQHGSAIYIGVLEQNGAAERFWRREGFVELRRERHVSDTGHEGRLIVMRHREPSTGPA